MYIYVFVNFFNFFVIECGILSIRLDIVFFGYLLEMISN